MTRETTFGSLEVNETFYLDGERYQKIEDDGQYNAINFEDLDDTFYTMLSDNTEVYQ